MGACEDVGDYAAVVDRERVKRCMHSVVVNLEEARVNVSCDFYAPGSRVLGEHGDLWSNVLVRCVQERDWGLSAGVG